MLDVKKSVLLKIPSTEYAEMHIFPKNDMNIYLHMYLVMDQGSYTWYGQFITSRHIQCRPILDNMRT